ncbi:hypothetical protein Tco_0732253 [Tanacetum coccineum]
MRHIDSSSKFSGIWKRECAVLPDGNNSVAIPEAATVRTILSSDRKTLVTAFHRNVFPVPPWPYTNISFGALLVEASFDGGAILAITRVSTSIMHNPSLSMYDFVASGLEIAIEERRPSFIHAAFGFAEPHGPCIINSEITV